MNPSKRCGPAMCASAGREASAQQRRQPGELAAELGVSLNPVKNQFRPIYEKLGSAPSPKPCGASKAATVCWTAVRPPARPVRPWGSPAVRVPFSAARRKFPSSDPP